MKKLMNYLNKNEFFFFFKKPKVCRIKPLKSLKIIGY